MNFKYELKIKKSASLGENSQENNEYSTFWKLNNLNTSTTSN